MNRNLSAALRVTLAALCLLYGSIARPAAAGTNTPPQIPDLVRPSLFEGFEPIEPEAGLSPSGEYFVFQDDEGFHVIRLDDSVETYRLRNVTGYLQVGFDPSDERLFLLESLPGGREARFRFVDPFNGEELRSDRVSLFTQFRTNFDASVNVLIEPEQSRSRVVVFDWEGFIVYRRTFSRQVQVALSAFSPVAAFLEGQSNGQVRVEVLDALRGRIAYRETVSPFAILGFSPYGAAFVIAQPVSPTSFRVRLINAKTGGTLVTRSFSGPVNAGFSPDGSLLGVVSRRGLTQELAVFRVSDGRQVVFGR